MRLARFEHNSRISVGLVDPVAGVINGIRKPSSHGDAMIGLIRAQVEGLDLQMDGEQYTLSEVRLLPPIAQPSKNILCIGKNYAAHAAEFAPSGFDASAQSAEGAVPDSPIIFSKAPCTMIGANDAIDPPWDITSMVDYEGELGVVIGRGGRRIARANCGDHVWLYGDQ